MGYETIRYEVDGSKAVLSLNIPERLNAIVPPMPDEFEAAIGRATSDEEVKVIVVRGLGRSFCAGYDFSGGFKHWDAYMNTDGRWDPGKDFVMATAPTLSPTQKFMSMWRTPKPVIAQVHGWCVGGGSDMALCADLIVTSDDAQIGTPYARMWGTYLSGLWIYRLGLTRVKELGLFGHPLSGREAAEVGLVNRSVPFEELESTVDEMAAQLATIPSSQLAAQKLVINQAFEHMGLSHAQTLGPILDGLMRNTPDAHQFIELAEEQGVAAATSKRDRPFNDYSMDPERSPDPRNVIHP